jgi:hypothetical protein
MIKDNVVVCMGTSSRFESINRPGHHLEQLALQRALDRFGGSAAQQAFAWAAQSCLDCALRDADLMCRMRIAVAFRDQPQCFNLSG